eukprot:m.161302 g.161302  ORF g.161302 m.161302 type:complete len:480 (+) comp31225_c0_seq1:229-1668(+)
MFSRNGWLRQGHTLALVRGVTTRTTTIFHKNDTTRRCLASFKLSHHHPLSPYRNVVAEPREQLQSRPMSRASSRPPKRASKDVFFDMFGSLGAKDREYDDVHDEDEAIEGYDPVAAAQRKKKFITGKGKKFVDLKRILVRGGRGGNGCVSWHQEPWIRTKKPDGADGGNGGGVVIVAHDRISSLEGVGLTVVGHHGKNGKGKSKVGANQKSRVVRVPPGCIIRKDGEIVADLAKDGEEYIAAFGGQGGRGNTGGAESTRVLDVEDERMQGLVGSEDRIEIELKTIADVGLVGLPNAGKSTFLSAVSRAHPKVAPYPFTTLNPHLGRVEFKDHFYFSVADIPGLAPGASENVGLGHAFLRHIERNHILVYLIDMSGENGSLPACDALRILQNELKIYNPTLATRTSIIAANKMDRGKVALDQLKLLKASTTLPVIPLSAKTGSGVTTMTGVLRKLVERLRTKQEKKTPEPSFQDQLFEKK